MDELYQYEVEKVKNKAKDLIHKLENGFTLAMTSGYHGEDIEEDLQFLVVLLLKNYVEEEQ